MAKKKKASKAKTLTLSDHEYGALLNSMVDLLESARRVSARAVNSVMTATYWEIGRRMVEWEQHGRGRAEYGEEVVKQLALDLTKQFGRGFSWRNLYQMRRFFEAYPDILQTASAKSADDGGQTPSLSDTPGQPAKLPTVSAISQADSSKQLAAVSSLTKSFPLPWSHYELCCRALDT